jgi:hypothetical protein
LLVLGTVGLRTWRSYHQDLPRVAERGKSEGIPALEEGNFDMAFQLLSAARQAVDALGGAVEGAEQIRKAADEAAIFVDLIPDSLEDLLDEAGRSSPKAWESRFETLYKGRAVIIQARISGTPESTGLKRYEIDYLVFPGGEASNFGEKPPRYARIDLTGFEAITLIQPHIGDHVLFGARLASFQFDSEAREWVIGFQPKTGTSITHNKALESLGWPSSSSLEESRAALEGQ